MRTPTARRVEIGQGIVIQASNLEAGNMRYELSGHHPTDVARTTPPACRVWMIGVS
jgi:hypothetical protein